MLINTLIIIGIILIIFYLFLFFVSKKIESLEQKIKKLFSNRTNLIPSIYEITKKDLNMYENIFKDILVYRKHEFYKIDNNEDFFSLIYTETLIHNELNFIFKVSNKHNKLIKNERFIYLRELVINKSAEIGQMIEVYKKAINIYNKLIKIKDFSIIGFLVPIYKKNQI